MDASLRQLLENVLLYVLLPVWMAAGLGDWVCHRVLKMEHTAGLKESLMHLLMLAELGPCLLLALFAEINALVFCIFVVACIAHELTVWWDLNYAIRCREIPVIEQWLHSFQIAAPWVSLAALVVLHFDQARAIVGLGGTPDWTLQWKIEALPLPTTLGLLCAGAVLIGGPFLEEAWRCWRVQREAGLTAEILRPVPERA
jgi:hypothetical protein